MDRFIAEKLQQSVGNGKTLKSNMDRFIGLLSILNHQHNKL